MALRMWHWSFLFSPPFFFFLVRSQQRHLNYMLYRVNISQKKNRQTWPRLLNYTVKRVSSLSLGQAKRGSIPRALSFEAEGMEPSYSYARPWGEGGCGGLESPFPISQATKFQLCSLVMSHNLKQYRSFGFSKEPRF